jgi:hypothetical protein
MLRFYIHQAPEAAPWSAPAWRRFGRTNDGRLTSVASPVQQGWPKRRQAGSPTRQPRWGAHVAALQRRV